MRLFLRVSLFFFVLVISEVELFALTDYEIKKICKREKKWSSCVKNLQEKRFYLQNGSQIEIPVIPHKR